MKTLMVVMMAMLFGMGWTLKAQMDENQRSQYLVRQLANSVDDLSSEVRKLRVDVVEAKKLREEVLAVVPKMEERVAGVEEQQRKRVEEFKAVESQMVGDVNILTRALQNKFGPEKWYYMVNEAKVQAYADGERKSKAEPMRQETPAPRDSEGDVLRSRWVWR